MITAAELLSLTPPRCDRDGGRADSLFILPSDLELMLCYRCTLKHGAELLEQGACVTGIAHADGYEAVTSVKVGTATD